ncbi:MAG: sugar transferase [Fuerstiella sp.]
MVKRLFDITAASLSLLLFGPIIILAAIGVKLSSPGPAFYCARRAGINGRPFTLFKLRTMHVNQGTGASAVTGQHDPRIFRFGELLRKLKLDELPQLWNILRGDMSVVGPRPEDMVNVERYYDDLGLSTLTVRPGLAGVGSIYNYTHGERMLTGSDPEQIYARELLPLKLALEAVYLDRACLSYDLSLIARTLSTILRIAAGQTQFPDPPEMDAARILLTSGCTAPGDAGAPECEPGRLAA